MLAGTPILTLAEHDVHRGAVRRAADGTLWIAHWLRDMPERVAGTLLNGLQPGTIRVDDRILVGGRLAPDATTVEVLAGDDRWYRAEVDQGAWVAFVPDTDDAVGLPPARFHDAAGGLVSRVSSRRAALGPPIEPALADLMALAPCRACGQSDWQVEPAWHGRGQVTFCGTCGHSDGSSCADPQLEPRPDGTKCLRYDRPPRRRGQGAQG